MKQSILYIEDDAINAFVMQKLLDQFYTVVHKVDGEGGLDAINHNTYKLVLMDINLGRGKMDGIETMKKMKATQTAIKVIAVTAYSLPEDKARFLAEGFDDYIPKPIDRSILLSKINSFLMLGQSDV